MVVFLFLQKYKNKPIGRQKSAKKMIKKDMMYIDMKQYLL
jgi:hypothetical protein